MDNLEHSGVKGMKWGVRKKKTEGPSKRMLKKNPAYGMSDAELRAKLNRMQMEAQYKQMVTPNKTIDAKKEVTNLLLQSSRVIAQRALTSSLEKYGGMAISALLAAR